MADGQKLAALKHLSAFIAKRPPRSGGGDRGKTSQIDCLEKIAKVLNSPVKKFFNYIQLKELDEETQQLAYKVFRSVIREMREK